jgi:muramoyltetrapeptide carboxypeptidase LdcA involved in peptidoglycan recycling
VGVVAGGQLVAGCLETICRHLKGSQAWLDLQGALLVLETSEEMPPPHQVDAYLAELANAAVFEQSTGLVVARPYGYKPTRRGSCGPRWLVGRKLGAYPCSATWSMGTPTPC